MAVTDERDFSFDLEWEAAEGVGSNELRATWARFEMRIGDDVVTQVHDAVAASVRRSIYVPLYPLAEWIAFNWWYLRLDARPSHLPRRDWSFRSRLRLPSHRTSWLTNHNLRSIGDGFAWPDLTIIPSSETTQLAWQGDKHYPPGWRVRFLASGEAELARDDVEGTLTSLVEAVLTRLDDHSITDTPLHQEWSALQAIDVDEAEFCSLAARLGLDPFGLSEAVAELIQTAGEDLEGALLDDFVDAANPGKLQVDLDWVNAASERVRSNDDKRNPIPSLDFVPIPASRAWELGLEDARVMRELMGIKAGEPVDLGEWVALEPVERADRALLGLGGTSEREALVLAISESRSSEATRFAEARALWRHARSASPGDRFLLTSARTPVQQAERAFAAEFLAPAATIRDFISSDEADAPVDLDEIAAVSDYLGVNEWVIEYQVINQLGREVDDPDLVRN